MAIDEAYMLPRNPEESRRLDQQHEFLRALAHGELIHQAVPRQSLRAVADIGTGTGVWLQETARELANSQPRPEGIEYKGFDISPSQLPDQNVSGVEFVVHDAAKAFPSQYHTKFDLVHVRLLSYATRAQELSLVVENIVQIMSRYRGVLCEVGLFLILCRIQSLVASSNGKNATPLIAGLSLKQRSRDLSSPMLSRRGVLEDLLQRLTHRPCADIQC